MNNFRFGHLGAIAIQGAPGITNAQIAQLGLKGAFTQLPSYAAGIPTLTFEGTLLSTTGSPVNTPTTSDTPTWEFADSFTMIRGKQSLIVGADFRHFVESRNLATNYLGGYTYNNATVLNNNAGCTTPSGICGTGNEVADFLLGYYTTAAAFTPGPLSQQSSPG